MITMQWVDIENRSQVSTNPIPDYQLDELFILVNDIAESGDEGINLSSPITIRFIVYIALFANKSGHVRIEFINTFRLNRNTLLC